MLNLFPESLEDILLLEAISLRLIHFPNLHSDQDTHDDEQDLAQGIEDILLNVVQLDEVFADETEEVEHYLKAEGERLKDEC